MQLPDIDEIASETKIRPGRQSDRAIIFSSWLDSYASVGTDPRKGGAYTYAQEFDPVTGRYSAGLYRLQRRIVIERLLLRAKLSVACSPYDDDTVLGWCCWEPRYLHYVWVKPEFRREGLAKILLSPLGGRWTCTHMTNTADHADKTDPAKIISGGSCEAVMKRWRATPGKPMLTYNPDSLLVGDVTLWPKCD